MYLSSQSTFTYFVLSACGSYARDFVAFVPDRFFAFGCQQCLSSVAETVLACLLKSAVICGDVSGNPLLKF